MHSPTKTYKDLNTLIALHYKRHGLNYFNLDYQKGIVYGKEYPMHMQPLVGYPKNTLGSTTYLLKLEGVLPSHTKTYKETNTLIRVFSKHHGFTLLEGYCSCSKLHNTPTISLIGYIKNTLRSITYIFKLGGLMHSPTNMG